MEENKQKAGRSPLLRSSVVRLTVEPGTAGHVRIILDGAYMASTGFEPGDTVEALLQDDLISILRAD